MASAQETQPLLSGKKFGYDHQSPDTVRVHSPSSGGSTQTEEASDVDIVASRLNGVSLFTILFGLWIGVSLSSMDVSIVATIYTKIGTEFKRSNEIIWIATAYMLSYTALQPLYGRISDIFGRKSAVVFATTFFFVGSVLCGMATGIWYLAIARIIAGIGGGGIHTLTTILISDLVPMRERGSYQGYSNIAYSVGSVIGAPLGGLLSDTVGWRWCFYINIPFLCITMYIMTFLLTDYNIKEQVEAGKSSDLWQRLKQVDYAGVITVVTAVSAFLIATSMGGNMVPWSHPMVIGGLSVSILSALAFCYVEKNWAASPLMPWHIISSRTPLACSAANLFLIMSSQSTIYLIPLFFQGVLGFSPAKSGLYYLPKVGAISIGSVYAGKHMARTGEYQRLTIFGSTLCVASMIGYASWSPSTSSTILILTTLTDGLSLGMVLTTTLIAMLSCVGAKEMATITSMSYLFRSTGGVIGISITSAIFQGLIKAMLLERITGPDAAQYIEIARKSMNDIRELLPKDVLEIVLETYQVALRYAFLCCVLASLLSLLSTFFIQRFELETRMRK
ncbi:MFS general substrate transporter [Hesseltinella vesiculosa]|uniref:MFS general substrate transporter n=1 Tax=Hesseltinella vesiculosa TaxID=101127 RepID=A0A1X2GJ89_9FUNG|nr:MFS general substrate transporter [Hesseltinella vesiculosa]